MIITVFGRANVGKSSFFNALIGSELSVVTNKKFTTNKCFEVVLNDILFIDTPGIILKKKSFVNNLIYSKIFVSDILLFVVNFNLKLEDFFILELLKNINKKIFLIISKCDNDYNYSKFLNFIQKIEKYFKFYFIMPFSSVNLLNIDLLRAFIFKFKPLSKINYQFSLIDFIIDIVRKNLLLLFKKEIPYNIDISLNNSSVSLDSNYFLIFLKCKKKKYKNILFSNKKRNLKLLTNNVCKDLKKTFYFFKFINIKII